MADQDRDTDKPADPRVTALGERLEEIARVRHPSRRQWALATGIHPGQLSNFLNGNAGISMERFLDLLRSSGAMLLIEEADEARPLRIGSLDAAGRLMSDLKLLHLPGSAVVTAAFGPFKEGDEVTFASSAEYLPNRWMLVQVGEDREVCRGDLIDGLAYLVTARGDEVRYRADRHTILGIVTSRRERM